jgi:RNA 2',3'-cyclic 3'-phosphodiesterase
VNPAMRMRVFVGVKIAPTIACELRRLARDLERFQVRLVAKDDVHLTLVPPWNETSIHEAVDKMRSAVDGFRRFALAFRRLEYGPDPERARLLWAACEQTKELAALRAALLQACEKTDAREFHPHVTLARLRDKGHVIALRCPINRDLSFTDEVGSVELFRSPPPGVVGYEVLASMGLGARAAPRP